MASWDGSQGSAVAGPSGDTDEVLEQKGSVPIVLVEETSLQESMDKNKESLKVKLMIRRPITQLVDQGIMPPLKSPAAYHEQRRQLERARMADTLKHKIQQRPDRQELVQHHILEDTNIDPAVQEKVHQLKRAKLADHLNDMIAHRPGPLELVNRHILETDETLIQALTDGTVSYVKTEEGKDKPAFSFPEDDSMSGSDGAPSPVEPSEHSPSIPSPPQPPPPPPLPAKLPVKGAAQHPPPPPPPPKPPTGSNQRSVRGTSPGASSSVTAQARAKYSGTNQTSRRSKKKPPKTQPKAKTIKFHEYKGPPNAQKRSSASLQTGKEGQAISESPYELLLKQQQLFLQWQLELQNKYPQLVLTTQPRPEMALNSSGNTGNVIQHSQDQRDLSKTNLEDLKVADLKAELKKRNLPVSGPKPQLIERLKPYADVSMAPTPPSVPTSSTITLQPVQSFTINLAQLQQLQKAQNPGQSAIAMSQPVVHDDNSVTMATPPTSPSSDINVGCGPMSVKAMSPENPDSVNMVASSPNPPSLQSPTPQVTTMNPLVIAVQPMQQVNNRNQLVSPVTSGIQTLATMVSPVNTTLPSQPTAQGTPLTNIQIRPASAVPMETEETSAPAKAEVHQNVPIAPKLPQLVTDQLIRQQQKKIEELELELKKSQLTLKAQQLGMIRQQQNNSTGLHFTPEEVKLWQKLQAKQNFLVQQQQKLQLQKQQIQQVTQPGNVQVMRMPVNSSLAQLQTKVHPSVSSTVMSAVQPLLITSVASKDVVGTSRQAGLNGIGHQRSFSLPGGTLFPMTNTTGSPSPSPSPPTVNESSIPVGKPPPDYSEATKQLINKRVQQLLQRPVGQGLVPSSSVPSSLGTPSAKSQDISDILDILIQHGELPASALQEPPPTPKTTISTTMAPVLTYDTQPSSAVIPTSSPLTMDNAVLTGDMQQMLNDQISNVTDNLSHGFNNNNDIHSQLKIDQYPSETADTNFFESLGLDALDYMKRESSDSCSMASVPNVPNNISTSDSMDISDWLDVVMPNTNAVPVVNSTSNEGDPVLATLNCSDTNSADVAQDFNFELLGDMNFDGIDFSSINTPTDLSALNWDRVDWYLDK